MARTRPESADSGDTVAWRTFVTEAEHRLRAAGFVSAEIDARRIVERASGYEGSDFFLGLDEPATERAVVFFDQMLSRRLEGEPLQYVLGAWGFRSLDLMVDRRVLIPRPETEVVVEWALGEIDRLGAVSRSRPLRVVDLGTGSGAIALAIACERDGVEVWGTDRSTDALDVARANLAGIGRAATRVRLFAGEWFDALPVDRRGGIDVIVANPPYVAAGDDLPREVRDWEPTGALIAGPTGLEDIDRLITEAPAWLAPHGALVVEFAPQQVDEVVALARAAGFARVEVGKDTAGRDRVLVAEGSSSVSR